MKKFAKILSILCALALIASCVSVGFIANAAEATMSFTDYDTFNAQTSYDVYGANRLAGATVSANATEIIDGVPKAAGSWTPGAGLTDNSPAAQQMIQVTWPSGAIADNAAAAKDHTSTNKYLDYTFALPSGINNPEMVLLAFVQTNTSVNWSNTFFDCRHWAIYASDSAETLYSGEPIYYRQQAGQTAPEYKIDISGLELKNVKYLGVRVYNFYFWGTTVLFSEIGLYGGTSVFTSSDAYTSVDGSYATLYGANRLTGSTITKTQTHDDVVAGALDHDSSPNRLTDNGTSSGENQMNAKYGTIGAAGNTSQKAEYIELKFALTKAVANPESLLIAYRTGGYASKHFEVFASENEVDLFGNSVYEHVDSSASAAEQRLALSNVGTVKYFAIRFYELPSATYALLYEVALYGGEVVKAASITTGYQNYSVGTVYTTYGQNHLEYAIGEAISTDGTTTKASAVAVGSVDGLLNDKSTIAAGDATVLTADNNGLDQTAAYLQLQYTLNAPVDNPEKFVFIHHTTDNGSYNSAHYAVFASDSLDTLYDKALYEFKADAGVGNTHVIDISEFELQNVKYAAIRLYHRAYENCKQHIEEFGLYGGTMEAGFDTNSTAAFPNTSWGSNNILTGKAVSAVSDNGSSVVPFENTDSYLEGFTDNAAADNETGAIYPNGLNAGGSFKVTWALGGTLDNPTTVKFQAGWGIARDYVVYASATLDDLFNAENAIVDVAGYTDDIVYKAVTTDIAAQNLTGIKYIGLEIKTTDKAMIQVTEFEVKGGTYTKEPEVSISLGASVFASTAGENANDITYRTQLSVGEGATVVDMGIISGFKVNIDADAGFQSDTKPEEYAEYLKTAPATTVKVSATAEQITNPELYFHVTNSGTAGTADYSGYKLVTIAYVTVEFEGEEYTYYSNVINKSSKQISRNQARNYYNMGGEYKEIADTAYAGYDFTNASTDINKVREYVEAVNAKKAQ